MTPSTTLAIPWSGRGLRGELHEPHHAYRLDRRASHGRLELVPDSEGALETKQSQIADWIIAENEGKYTITSVKPGQESVPLAFALQQNYPNPSIR